MKKQRILACLLGSTLLLQALPAAAVYQNKDDITLAVRPMDSSEGVASSGTQQVCVTPAAAAAGRHHQDGADGRQRMLGSG